MRRFFFASLLVMAACGPPADDAPAPSPTPSPPAAPAQPIDLGVTVERAVRIQMTGPSIFDPGAPQADVVLLVIKGPQAMRAWDIGETIGGNWMVGLQPAHHIAFAEDRAVLAVLDPGSGLAGERLWFFDTRALGTGRGAERRAEVLSAQVQAHRRVEESALASVPLGDGDAPTPEIEERGDVANIAAFRHLARAILREQSK